MQIFLAHGASGGVETMAPWIDALRKRGLDARAVGLPRGNAERAIPAYREQIAGTDPAQCVIGGHSFGGRVASLVAANQPVAGLILLSYPLHLPGRPEQLRTAHWSEITCPTLLMSGESDPFARLSLLQSAIGELDDAELITYPNVGHGLKPVLAEAVDVIVSFVARIESRRSVSEE